MNTPFEKSEFVNVYVSGVRFGEVDITTDKSPIPQTFMPSLDGSEESIEMKAAQAAVAILAEWSKDNVVYRLRDSQSKLAWQSLDVGNIDVSNLDETEINSIKKTLSSMHNGSDIILFNDFNIDLHMNSNITHIPEVEGESTVSIGF